MKTIDIPALFDLLATRPKAARVLVAIAGAPGSGKSTVAEALVAQLNQVTPGRAAVLPMDGYHYDNMLLGQLGRLARKGAPDTFDISGLRHMLARLRDNFEDAVVVPVFDRDLEIARAGARLIPASVDIIVVEGNYLLLRVWKINSLARRDTIQLDTQGTGIRVSKKSKPRFTLAHKAAGAIEVFITQNSPDPVQFAKHRGRGRW
jgi:pantothenate kinase